MKQLKIAIVHDYIKEYGGAERVLEALHEIYPEAVVYTSVYLPKFLGPHRQRFKNWKIKTSIAQYLPFKEKLISPLRIISPLLFKQFDFSKFDVVIVSQTGAYFPNVISKIKDQRSKTQIKNKKLQRPIHICYTHTPPRYLYGYKTAREWKNNVLLRILGETANHFLRVVDFYSSRNVDYFLTNSNEVKARIKKFYHRDAVVIYPPVKINSKFQFSNPKQITNTKYKILNTEYYLTGGRLARAKGTDIIIEAFKKLNKPLKVFGKGFAGFERELKVQSSTFKVDSIEFLGEVTDEEKLELMKNAKAFVFASFDEDFGITPVEAMGIGVPVIAYNSGGVKETVIDGETGVLYDKNTPEELIKAVKRLETLQRSQGKRMSEDCVKQAQKFSEEKFKEKIKQMVKKIDNKDYL